MQVKTQPFKEALELKNDGISFNVYGSGSKRLGDLCVTKGGLVWCKTPGGKASAGSGINVKWEEFINWVQSRRAAAKNAAAKNSVSRNGVSSKLSSPIMGGMKATSQSGKLGASRSSSGKMPSDAGKLAAQRAAVMKAAASAKQEKSVAMKGSAAMPGTKNGLAKLSAIKSSAIKSAKSSGAKSPTVKSAQGQAKSKMPAISRKPSSAIKTSAARGKAN